MEDKHIRILMVEDEPDYHAIIRMVLTKEVGDLFELMRSRLLWRFWSAGNLM